MFRRIALTVAMVATLVVAGLGITGTAEARHGCGGYGGGYGGYGGGYSAYYAPNYSYYPPVVYRSSYYPANYYYGAPVYRGGDCYHGHCHDRGGVYFSVGF